MLEDITLHCNHFHTFWMFKAGLPGSLLAKRARAAMRHPDSGGTQAGAAGAVPASGRSCRRAGPAERVPIFNLKCTLEERSSDTARQSIHNYSYCRVSTPASALRDERCSAVKATRSEHGEGGWGKLFLCPSTRDFNPVNCIVAGWDFPKQNRGIRRWLLLTLSRN